MPTLAPDTHAPDPGPARAPETAAPPAATDGDGPRIGPNAVTRALDAVRGVDGDAAADTLALAADLPDDLPGEMIPEAWFLAVVRTLHDMLGRDDALDRLARAGDATGAYVLENRIPLGAQGLLRILPGRAGLPLLLSACARNAWTFAGAGRFSWERIPGGARLTLEGSPTCRERPVDADGPGAGSFYVAAFRHLVRELISRDAAVAETACVARGDEACRFDVALRPPAPVAPARSHRPASPV